MVNNKLTLCILIALTFLITAISYKSYLEHGWYDMDDYLSINMSPAGTSVLESCEAITHSLYRKQKRYQPVRLCVFVAFTRLFEEENSAYYNFALHLINILLLFLVLRKFNVGTIFSLISVLLFAVFGRFRYMDSTSVMVGGSGLNLFFILTAFLFLIKGLQATARELLKKYSFLALSALAYAGLVFSYELAVPLFASLIMVFYLFNPTKKGFFAPFKTKKSLYLLLYLAPLLFYIIFYRLLVKVNYEGAEIVWSLNIFIRLKSYILYTLIPPLGLHTPAKSSLIVLLLYFMGIIWVLKSNRIEGSISDKKKAGLKLLLFGAIFYPATVVIFTLNDWHTPLSVMRHHTYLMTAAGSILIASLSYNLQWVFPRGIRKAYLVFLIVLLVPFILLNGAFNASINYNKDSKRTRRVFFLRNMKKGIQTTAEDVDTIDAILIKNFYWPYYEIRSTNGVLKKWFGFKKDIMSGREIISVSDDEIVFKGPLNSYAKPRKQRAKNDRVRIFFVSLEDGTLMAYHNFVDFESGLNIYQTIHVKEHWKKEDFYDQHRLEAILSNFKKNSYLNIWFKSSRDLDNFFKNSTLIEVNDKRVPSEKISVSGARLTIDVSESTKKINYFFLKMLSRDDRFKQSVRLLAMTEAMP